MSKSGASFVVLLVEDEQADANLVQWAFNKNKIQVDLRHFSDGYEVLSFLRKIPPKYQEARLPDLILLDLNMPRMNGFELLATIKSDAALAEVPVVVLSTSHAERDISAAKALGAADFFSKPMDIHQLVETIRILSDRWVVPRCFDESRQ
jgi:DNA-binding response OmpR family regulator